MAIRTVEKRVCDYCGETSTQRPCSRCNKRYCRFHSARMLVFNVGCIWDGCTICAQALIKSTPHSDIPINTQDFTRGNPTVRGPQKPPEGAKSEGIKEKA